MIASNLLLDIYRAYRGKPDTRTPTWGTDKANLAISIANRKLIEWATDPRNKWNSLFELDSPNETGTVATAGTTALTGTDTYFTDYNVGDKITVDGETVRTIATITSDTVLTVTSAFSNTASGKTFTRQIIIDEAVNSYILHRNFYLPSDFLRITKSDGTYFEYPIIPAQKRNTLDQAGYVHSLNPKQLTLATTIDSQQDGAVLTLPGYYQPSAISTSTDVVQIDDPNWLVYATAAELARNDAAKDDMYPILTGMANDLYSKMSNANSDNAFLQPNSITNNMPQVSLGPDENWLA
jgi:hypothetical protein